jgi:hypothetical protein
MPYQEDGQLEGPDESKANKGRPGGYAGLDATGKVPSANLPSGGGGGGGSSGPPTAVVIQATANGLGVHAYLDFPDAGPYEYDGRLSASIVGSCSDSINLLPSGPSGVTATYAPETGWHIVVNPGMSVAEFNAAIEAATTLEGVPYALIGTGGTQDRLLHGSAQGGALAQGVGAGLSDIHLPDVPHDTTVVIKAIGNIQKIHAPPGTAPPVVGQRFWLQIDGDALTEETGFSFGRQDGKPFAVFDGIDDSFWQYFINGAIAPHGQTHAIPITWTGTTWVT